MDAGVLMPVIVAVLDVTTALGATFVCGVNANALGLLLARAVVTEKVAATPPTLTDADAVAPNEVDESTRTVNVWPLAIDPGDAVKLLPLIAYWPPTMVTGEGTLMPLIAAGVESIGVD